MKNLTVAKFGKSGNIKLGNSTWTFSKLAGNTEFTSVYGTCTGSCGKYCSGCWHRGGCYVWKSYRYPSVVKGHMRNTIAFRNDLDAAFENLAKQLDRARNKPFMVRINQAGELETAAEFSHWCDIASKNPGVNFWLYTKAFDIAIPALLAGKVPENVTVLVSIWHEYGVEEYNSVKHLSNVKAFVYMDGFNYSDLGIQVTTTCKAYNEAGKLDHDVTCDKCKKCFNRLVSCKVIGCNAH